ncbi:MAG: ferrochelatase [Deltaproteobacteria bacterium]|nr:ferrochelatase [Deltaproteobacteria bacterium]
MTVAAAFQPPTGVLLVNTGTPASTATGDVRRYLRQFLGDPRVIDLHPLARWLLLELVILPFRPARSAAAYRKIWTERGSPLLVHGRDLADGLRGALTAEADAAYVVELAMQFGSPSIPAALDRLQAAGAAQVVVVPLFPQYAAASYGSAAAAVCAEAARRWVVPSLRFVAPFWQSPAWLDAVVAGARAEIAAFAPDHVLLSYHGVPERHCARTDPSGAHCLRSAACCDALVPANAHCYRAQCMATSRALVAALGLDPQRVTTAFQSRLGRTPWIKPYADRAIADLGKAGVQRLLVVEPSFVADCLETLEEIGIRGRADFRAAGGGELRLCPSLNASAVWVRGLATLVREASTQGPARANGVHQRSEG